HAQNGMGRSWCTTWWSSNYRSSPGGTVCSSVSSLRASKSGSSRTNSFMPRACPPRALSAMVHGCYALWSHPAGAGPAGEESPMRWKIIFVNGGVVMVVAVLTYFLLAASLSSVVANPAEQKRELARALRGASSQLALDGLRMERWLAQQVVTRPVREVYQGGTAAARS